MTNSMKSSWNHLGADFFDVASEEEYSVPALVRLKVLLRKCENHCRPVRVQDVRNAVVGLTKMVTTWRVWTQVDFTRIRGYPRSSWGWNSPDGQGVLTSKAWYRDYQIFKPPSIQQAWAQMFWRKSSQSSCGLLWYALVVLSAVMEQHAASLLTKTPKGECRYAWELTSLKELAPLMHLSS